MRKTYPSAILEFLTRFIIMSNTQVNKADGCSVFFSVIIVAVLAVLIVGLYNLFRPEDPIAATSAIDKQRAGKIGDHRIDNSNYLDKVDTFHAEKNSSLQTVMEKVAESYRSNSNSNK